MAETILFCLVFLSQVLLISWFYPKRFISRERYVLRNFPPSTHPKLYPQPTEYYERRLRNFERLNFAIVVAGLLIIVALILGTLGGWDGRIVTPWSSSGEWDAAIVTPFFLVQIVATTCMEYSNFKHRIALAKAPPPRVRTTELRRRRLVDFVSPATLVVAALTNVAFVAFVLYCYRHFELSAFKTVVNIAIVALMLVVFSVSIAITMRAPKPDPYQAPKDRRSVIRVVVQQALAFCIAYPVLMTALLSSKFYDPDLLEPVLASLFVLGIALALLWPSYSYRADTVDFDVYRGDA